MIATSETTSRRHGAEGAVNGPWDEAAITQLRAWDPGWAEIGLGMAANPWRSGVLPRKTAELIGIAVNAACTNLNADGVRRHVRGALSAGASRDEILMVLKMASLLSIHSCSLGAPILLEEARAAGAPLPKRSESATATPVCEAVRAAGQWNEAWTPFLDLDPPWTEQFMAAGIPVYAGRIFSPKDAELLSIALDAAISHMYAPGTRRHIRAALAHGASVEEIMEVLKLSALQQGVSRHADLGACRFSPRNSPEQRSQAEPGDTASDHSTREPDVAVPDFHISGAPLLGLRRTGWRSAGVRTERAGLGAAQRRGSISETLPKARLPCRGAARPLPSWAASFPHP